MSEDECSRFFVEGKMVENRDMEHMRKDLDFLHIQYTHFGHCWIENEKTGDVRPQFFIGITTAVIAALALLATSDYAKGSDHNLQEIATVAVAALIFLGVATFIRLLRRNEVSDEYLKILAYITEEVKKRSHGLHDFQLPFSKKKRRWFLRFGYAETIALLNSCLFAFLTCIWLPKGYLLFGLVGFVLCFIPHMIPLWKRDKKK